MIRKDKKTFKDGSVKTQIRVTEGYRPYPNTSPKQRTIKSFGYLEDQADLESFWKEVNACNDSLKHKRNLRIEIPVSEMMYSENNRLLNYGYKFPEAVYHLLGIDSFFEQYQKTSGFRGKYSLNEIFRYLVTDRILYPASKREAASRLLNYYGLNSEFDLPDIYRALDQFDLVFYDLQRFVSEHVAEMFGRNLQYSFYDVTNYYTEKDFADPDEVYRNRSGKLVTGPALGQKGVSKEHQLTPIIQMGLFMDGNGVPVCMDIFRGNMGDSDTLKENLDGFKKEYGIERTVVVADKGMNCSHNIDLLCSQGDGYVFSQILKGTKGKRYREALFAPEGWREASDGSYRWKLITEEYQGHDIIFEMQDGQKIERKKKVTRMRKVLLYWSKADAEMAAKKREEKLKKAEKSTKNNAYGIVHGKDRYVKEETILKETGEVLNEKQTVKVSKVDQEKAEKDSLYDGYFAIITSELDYNAAKIREVYHGLWRIEESFRIMKSDFDARPIYLNKREHIRAHFLICFIALVILRLIQNGMGEDRLSVERIAEALRGANCLLEKGGYVRLLDVGGGKIRYEEIPDRKSGKLVPGLKFSSEDQVALDYRRIQETFGTNFYYAYAKQEDFKRFFKEMELVKRA